MKRIAVPFICSILLSTLICTFSLDNPISKPKNETTNDSFQNEKEETSEEIDAVNSQNKVGNNDKLTKTQQKLKNDTNYQQRVEAARKKWKLIFEEIKSYDNIVGRNVNGTSFFDQWKLLLDSAEGSGGVKSFQKDNKDATKRMRQRFDGFASWEKKLQQWAEDTANNNLLMVDNNKAKGRKSNETALSIIPSLRFSPRPAKPGEEILPHTDIADKSKNIWIVTTASLPWFTGTAVNPLLRAAYLTAGRAEAGGSVTLMIPWLERESDRESIYGKNKIFKSPEEQEEWIRTWLRDTADLKQASEELKIKWYTGRVEKLENSVYSMGDITALLPVSFSFVGMS